MSIWSEHAAREREKAMSDDLGDEWMPLDRAIEWMKARIGDPSFLSQNWDCKYMDARIDMRLGSVFLRPGNPGAKPELAPGGSQTQPNRSAPESGIGAASQVVTNLRSTLENAINDLDTAIERECMEDVGIVVAYMREALAAPDEPNGDEHLRALIQAFDDDAESFGSSYAMKAARQHLNRPGEPT